MRVYCIDQKGYFTGQIGTAQPHPIHAGEYLIPAFSVAKMPPDAPAGYIQRWIDDDWTVEKLPQAEKPVEPLAPPRVKSVQQQQAEFYLRLADEHIAAARQQGIDIPADWTAYRSRLAEIAEDERDIAHAMPYPPPVIEPPKPEAETRPPLEPAPTLDDIKQGAIAQISGLLDRAASSFTGASPFAEQLSWSVKQDAARAWQAGAASPEQEAMLHAEAAITGETVDNLAAVILDAASSYWAAAGSIAGLRRILAAAINNCPDIPSINRVLAEAQQKISAFAG